MAAKGYAMKRSHESENARVITYTLMSVYRNPDKPLPPIEKFWPLPTDDLEAIERMRQEEGSRLEDKLKSFKQKYMPNAR